jgi:hypothetical protein
MHGDRCRCRPRVIGEVCPDLVFVFGGDHEQRRSVIRVADRTAEGDHALVGEGCVRVPAELLAPRS